MTRRFLSAVVIIGMSYACSAVDSRNQKNAEAAKLLTYSHAIAEQNIDKTVRGYYLARLTRVAAKISHVDTVAWCEEQFNLADQIKPEWNRVATQKNALTALARVDSKAAMRLLKSISPPPYPDPDQPPPEDLLSDSAVVIFASYFQAFGDLGTIESEASRIKGSGGDYPYRAMLLIIEELHRLQGERASNEINGIFGNALTAYQSGSVYANSDAEFLALLEGAQFVVSQPLYEQALHIFIQHLLDTLSKPTSNFTATVSTAKGVFSFHNKSEMLLFRAYALVMKFPKWAEELRNKYSSILENAGDDIQDIQQQIIEGNVDQDRLRQMQAQMEENAAASRIDSLTKVNPWAALDIAAKLPTAGDRIASFSNILPNMLDVDPREARAIYSRQLEDAKSLGDDPAVRLTSTVALAKAAFHVGDVNAFADFVVKALDYGTELFDKSSGLAITRPGYAELIDLAEFCTSQGADWVVNSIRQIQNQELKAYLLIYAAKGITEQKTTFNPTDQVRETKDNPIEPSRNPPTQEAKTKKPN